MIVVVVVVVLGPDVSPAGLALVALALAAVSASVAHVDQHGVAEDMAMMTNLIHLEQSMEGLLKISKEVRELGYFGRRY